MTQEDSRFVIGVDLGTTNSCVAYVDTDEKSNPSLSIQPFSIPQWTAQGTMQGCDQLPSFCYLPASHEFSKESHRLPWQQGQKDQVLGQWAKDLGAQTPSRLVQSAKSWLCHGAINRKDPCLPPDAEADRKISPVEATRHYLEHLRLAWNTQAARGKAEKEWEQQEIVLTVPASFDEVARQLTVEAARQAGFPRLTLLEEPQAAFYSWMASHEKTWQEHLKDGDLVVVCDVGGGTTDFSLIAVEEKEGTLSFQRTDVGDHLLLGGDNIDATVCHLLQTKLEEQGCKLQAQQWEQLRHQARRAKETLFSEQAPDTFTAVIQGDGARLVGGSVQISVTKEEVESMVLSGFFPILPWEEAIQLNRGRGLQTVGLPYESEPAITKHLAHFLKRLKAEGKKPTHLLFNGGTMTPPAFQQAIVQAMQTWFGSPPEVLNTYSLDRSVARGAAYYGKARRGLGVTIKSGLPRSYYLGIETSDGEKRGLTLLTRGAEAGASFSPDKRFLARPNRPVSFTLYSSQTRLEDQAGQLIALDEEQVNQLPPIHTVLKWGKDQNPTQEIEVAVHVTLTEIGTLELYVASTTTPHKWNLEFQVRNAAGQDDAIGSTEERQEDVTLSEDEVERAQDCIRQAFTQGSLKPREVMAKLEEQTGQSKWDWPVSLLRSLADTTLDVAFKRGKSPAHEARWWNLIGFFLRPGFGYPLDDHRMAQLWKMVLADFSRPLTPEVEVQFWICMRRVAAGLNRGKQEQLGARLFQDLLPKAATELTPPRRGNLQLFEEKIRAVGALELLDLKQKTRIGACLVRRIVKRNASSADCWALARIGARQLLRAPSAYVVPSRTCALWVEEIAKRITNDKHDQFVLRQLTKKTGIREIDLPEEVTSHLPGAMTSETIKSETERLPDNEEQELWGDRLPSGLIMME